MFEFENGDQPRAWLNSPEYAELDQIFKQAVKMNVVIVDGV